MSTICYLPVYRKLQSHNYGSHFQNVASLRGLGKHFNKVYSVLLAEGCKLTNMDDVVNDFSKNTRCNVFEMVGHTAKSMRWWPYISMRVGELKHKALFTASIDLQERRYRLDVLKQLTGRHNLFVLHISDVVDKDMIEWNLSVVESAGLPYYIKFVDCDQSQANEFGAWFHNRYPNSSILQQRDYELVPPFSESRAA